MTTTDARLVIRPPGWLRACLVALPLAAAVVCLTPLVPLRGDPGWFLRGVLPVAVALLCWRMFRLAAIETADGRLVVRNVGRDRVLDREDVADVVADPLPGDRRRRVRLVLLHGASVPLDVTEVPFDAPSRDSLARHAAAVRAWVDGRPQPSR